MSINCEVENTGNRDDPIKKLMISGETILEIAPDADWEIMALTYYPMTAKSGDDIDEIILRIKKRKETENDPVQLQLPEWND